MAEKTEPLLPNTAVPAPRRSLEQAVREEGRLPIPSVVWIGAQVASALAEMHEAGDSHGDIGPGSILEDGEQVVLGPGPGPGSAGAGGPEEDLRRLGASLRYAVEGHLHDGPAPTNHAGPLQPLIEELLSQDPSHRLTAAQVRDRLLALLHAPSPAAPFLDRRRLLGLGAAGLLAAAVPPAAYFLLREDGPPALAPLGRLTQEGFFTLAFDPSSKALATIGNFPDRGELRLWNVKTRTQTGETLTDPSSLSGLAFSPDGRRLAVGFSNHVYLWDLATGAKTDVDLDQGDNTVFSLAFSPDGRRLAVGCNESVVNLWDVEQRVQIKALHHGLPVSSLSFSPDGRLLAGGGCADEKLGWAVLWDTETHTQAGERFQHADWVTKTELSPDGRLLATGCFDGRALSGTSEPTPWWQPSTTRTPSIPWPSPPTAASSSQPTATTTSACGTPRNTP